MAACSSGTRIVGCILVFALVVQLYIDMEGTKISFGKVKTFVMDMLKAPKKILSVLVCPLGAFAYMAFLNFFCGDAWAYKNVQIAWREDEYFPIIGVLWKACTGQIEPRYTYMGVVLYCNTDTLWIYVLQKILLNGSVRNYITSCAIDITCYEYMQIYGRNICCICGSV